MHVGRTEGGYGDAGQPRGFRSMERRDPIQASVREEGSWRKGELSWILKMRRKDTGERGYFRQEGAVRAKARRWDIMVT